MVNYIFDIALTVSYLLYFIPVWLALRWGGWKGYLRIKNRVAGCFFEFVSALILAFLLLLAIPDLAVWLVAFICRLFGFGAVFGVSTMWPLFSYLYPACLALFLFYLIWKKRQHKTSGG